MKRERECMIEEEYNHFIDLYVKIVLHKSMYKIDNRLKNGCYPTY
jgi:hypothetical protein